MKYLLWLLKAAIFFALFAFALNNQDPVLLRLFGAQWEAPLVLLLLAALVVGVFLGMAVMLPLWLRARRAAKALSNSPSGVTASPTPSETTHGI
ncbi:lipopolysaccharide assembly protein LapA domain-containing protein [Malikia spinosa]|uniref:lipopolysaccharide assembly protein LapA domain-containing protein n=1 Tax=Malikia spinosa TaxID=86180 RepID=UPI003FA21221